MSDDEVTRRIVGIIADQAMLDPADVSLDASPESLGIDSLGLVEIVFAIEEAFEITIPYNANDPSDSAFRIDTIGGIVDAVKRLIAEKG